ncbi:hypothetical protein U9M48_002357, partial [Paspalum notatum var. saurae]
AEYLAEDADQYSFTCCGYIMINNSHGNYVDRVFMPYAQAIADADDDDVPTWSWGSAANAVLTGCPLLLQLWSYERFAIGRPMVDLDPYDDGMYGVEEDERPTMATLWIGRKGSWAHQQVRRVYPEFISEFDKLYADDVI